MNKCLHEVRLRAVQGEAFLDSNVIMMSMQFRCDRCGEPFRVLGISDGVSPDEPGVAAGGEVVFPIVPAGEEPQTVRVGQC